jgi:hypothetical protein
MNHITQENAASSEELAAVMTMFKTGGGSDGGQERHALRKQPPKQHGRICRKEAGRLGSEEAPA